ncbi:MAG: hypothetical protein GTO51_06435 [Candidatus Latescibacteria bacterium]|nr:hypothetical protein [Candidatus Latescibacterota bacterium]NIM21429.1 hypothetical protein [Candidatus Latescibacterota bacterium]NIM65610.1 hypothetical protein [Candidatus Latescibacterota bacterium]NIO01990.1 hypothetical protein [Candidatus Latescibacterota bacterium]NIO28802.1 hypothetical protein [Candidatus Latescibacterota bacterium]
MMRFHLNIPIEQLLLAACVCFGLALLGCNTQVFEPESFPVMIAQLPAAEGDTILISVRALVTRVVDPDSYLNGAVEIGDEVNGYYLYDESAEDSHKKPDIGQYDFNLPPFGMEMLVNDLAFRSDTNSVAMSIRLRNNAASGKRDTYRVTSSSNLDVLPGVGVFDILIVLEDNTATALTNDALSGIVVDLDDWRSKHTLTITGNDGWRIEADLASSSVGDPEAEEEDAGGSKRKFRLQ